jgi:hypothetical protein
MGTACLPLPVTFLTLSISSEKIFQVCEVLGEHGRKKIVFNREGSLQVNAEMNAENIFQKNRPLRVTKRARHRAYAYRWIVRSDFVCTGGCPW